jgi:hypothetical protein
LLLSAALGSACTPPAAGFRCEADSDCDTGFACRDGDCRELAFPDAGSLDAGTLDAGSVDAGAVDAGALDAGNDGGPLQGYGMRWQIDVGGGSAELNGFPLLVRIPDGALPLGIERDAVRFADIDGRVLAYEIEVFANPGESIAWVRLPTLPTTGTTIFLYATQAAPSLPSAEDPAAVWQGHDAVVHLSDPVAESTQRWGFPGEASETVNTGGQIGGAQRFAAGTGTIRFGGASGVPILVATNEATISAWVVASRVDAGVPTLADRWPIASVQVDATSPPGEARLDLEIREDYVTRVTTRRAQGAGSNQLNSQPTFVDDRFHHILARVSYSPAAIELFINGVQHQEFTSLDDDDDAGTPDANSFGFTIGTDDDGANRLFVGAIDEVRVLSRWVEAAWIEAEYINGTTGLSTFVSLVPDETANP